MRILTVRQPWAWAIIHGGKYVENRTNWRNRYRGPVAIHAAAAMAHNQYLSAEFVEKHATTDPPWLRAVPGHTIADALVLGAIIGVVDLHDVHPATFADPRTCCWPWGEASYVEAGARAANTAVRIRADVEHLVLDNPRPLPHPVEAKGRLGLWHDIDLLAEVRRQLTRGNTP